MNILFVAEKRNTPNYLCVHNVAAACQNRGYNVFILSQGYEKKEFYGENQRIKEYAIRPDFATNIVNKLSNVNLKKIGQLIYKFNIFLFTPIWPIRAPLYVSSLALRIEEIVKNEKVDMVILTHVSIENLLAAKYRLPNVVYVGYFLDLLVGGMKLSYMKENVAFRKTRSVEKKVFKYLDYIIMMDSSRKFYQNYKYCHNKKIIFLDLPMLSAIKNEHEVVADTLYKENIVLMFVGSMAKNIRDPHYILDVFSRIKDPKVRFVIIGSSDYSEVIHDYEKKDSRIIFLGRKSHEESQKLMKRADFLVNIGNKLENMVPSKIYEYMSYKKPIITTYKIDNDPCLPSLKKYGLFFAIDERSEVNKILPKLENFIQCKKIYNEELFYKLISKNGDFYNNTPDAFVDVIDTMKR